MYYILLSQVALAPVIDFGFSPTILRFVSYAMGGAETIQAHGVSKGAGSGPNFGLLWQLLFTTRALYRVLALIVLVQAFRAGPVTMHRIEGAIAAYLLLGITWASAYHFMRLLDPGAFTGAGMGAGTGAASFMYFSFVTLTTVGYGDVAPVHEVARSLAILEALTGQLYPAILLARLVSLEVVDRQR